jgi:hypothetical protein
MAADYGARSALSSTAVPASVILQCSMFFQTSFPQVPEKMPQMRCNLRSHSRAFRFCTFSCAPHQSFKQQLNVGQRHHSYDTFSIPEYFPCASSSP